MKVLERVIGPWTFEFAPDGDDPGVGNLTVRSSWGRPDMPLVQTEHDDVQRGEWDAFAHAWTTLCGEAAPTDDTLQHLAERYADKAEVRCEVDRALGVFHVPPHPEGECYGCDRARARGLVGGARFDRSGGHIEMEPADEPPSGKERP